MHLTEQERRRWLKLFWWQREVDSLGAKGYGHNYSDAARKSFKARHKCGTATNKLTARYWACKKLWAGKGGSTASSPKSRKGKY